MDPSKVLYRHTIDSIRPAEVTLTPVGACIYCNQTEQDGVSLEREHILADGFGGNLILPQASCRRCAKIIHKFETQTLKSYCGLSRRQLGIKSRKRRKNEGSIETFDAFSAEEVANSSEFLDLSAARGASRCVHCRIYAWTGRASIRQLTR